MRIAFYAPLKSPNHPVPSGDRLMAQLLVRALELAGHSVEIASEFRTFAATPEEAAVRRNEAEAELARLRRQWTTAPQPQLWFCYHPYYKSPDVFGPSICEEFGIAYASVEASYSAKRDMSGWAPYQKLVVDAVRQAAVNITLTQRDRLGLQRAAPDGRFASLKPFIDTAAFETIRHHADPHRLITVAMMRSGDKMDSYVMLAKALQQIRDRAWTMAVIGDGPKRAEVEALFADFEPGRIAWLGEKNTSEIADELGRSGIYVWPGCGEAYGLAYLEAQAAGLPVIAQSVAGVPEVVEKDVTGYLTRDGDVDAYAAAIAALLAAPSQRSAMGLQARRFVMERRSLERAAMKLNDILSSYLGPNA